MAPETTECNAIWPEHATPVGLFRGLTTCWRHHASGGLAGFDWVQVRENLRLAAIPRADWAALQAALAIMEDEVLAVAAERLA